MKDKCLCIDERSSLDTISTLPEIILETILCFLPTKQAARTSILSTEWRYKWTKLPKLEFSLSDVSKEITEEKQMEGEKMDWACKPFYDLLQILKLHQGPIHEFTLHTDLDYDRFAFDQVILYLSKNHTVKKLTFFGGDESNWDKLPVSVFSLHHLTDLNLSCCDIDSQQIFNEYCSLRSLSLDAIDICFRSLLQLLSNCPTLKSLTLFIFQSHFAERDCTIIQLFECLPLVEHLTIIESNIEWLVVDSVPQELPTLLVHLKYFCFEDIRFPTAHGLAFILILIKCSPNLEKLKLVSSVEDGDEEDIVVLEEFSNVWLEHLNELEIENLSSLKLEMEFVKFILARSPNLKKVSITSSDRNQESEMLKTLSQAPRSSEVIITFL